MAGFVKGANAWKQKMVGVIHNDLQDLRAKCPEAQDEIDRLSKHITHIIMVSMFGKTEHKMGQDMFNTVVRPLKK